MPGYKIFPNVFKDRAVVQRHFCPKCQLVLKDAVQLLCCGHRYCESCADELLRSQCATTKCLVPQCGEQLEEVNGRWYFPDRFARREINNLDVICPYNEAGCDWDGKFQEYCEHINRCEHGPKQDIHPFTNTMSPTQSLNREPTHIQCDACWENVRVCELKSHSKKCMYLSQGRLCPLVPLGCPNDNYMDRSELDEHLQRSQCDHLTMIANCIQLLGNQVINPSSTQAPCNDLEVANNGRLGPQSGEMQNTLPHQQHIEFRIYIPEQLQGNLILPMMGRLQAQNEEFSYLHTQVSKLEKQIQVKNAEIEDHDFRLYLIENSNHDGSMIWKIPQFSQRKADAQNGKYASIFSLPFYSGRYGYKMCLRLYIMGDGIGKGTHLSLFFVVMRGKFDNILEWPFTHEVTFKLINQTGGRNIVDTFQPDSMSSSFRKPNSDMNIASGCPRFVSHTELERGGFIVDDTIFIKCVIDTSNINHP